MVFWNMDPRTDSSASSGESQTSSAQSRTSAEVFIQNMSELVDRNDVRKMVHIQKNMMMRYEKTNEMLLNFNVLSANRYLASVEEFKKHTNLLSDMKKDLESIFKRIRKLKTTLSASYPDAFSRTDVRNSFDLEDTVTPKMSVSDSVDIRIIREEPEPEPEPTTSVESGSAQ